jgi:large subunit ribosomal protein L35
MNKQKTRKSLAKRFKVTPTGKVMHRSAFSRHLKKAKSKTQKGKYKKTKQIKGTMAKKIKQVLGK